MKRDKTAGTRADQSLRTSPSAPRRSGAGAHLGRVLRGALLALTLLAALAPAGASAFKTHFPVSFSPIDGSGIGAVFHDPSTVGIDESAGNILVYDGTAAGLVVDVLSFEGGHPAGIASPFQITGFTSTGDVNQVAVDNSPTSPSKGAVYVAQFATTAVKKFVRNPVSEEYELAGELTATPPFESVGGVAVDSDGNVFVSDIGLGGVPPHTVVEFDPSGAQIGEIPGSGTIGRSSSLAFDAAGDLFVQTNTNPNKVFKYPANGAGEVICGAAKDEACNAPVELTGVTGATGVAVDTAANALYVGLGDHVAQYNATSLAFEGEFGAGLLTRTRRLAADPASGRVYVADASALGEGASQTILVFGPTVGVPEPLSGAAENVANHAATITGSVDPSGEELTECRFEYGPTATYGQSLPCVEGTAEIGSGEGPVPVHADLSGLSSSTTYHFRLTAKNANTTSPRTGADKSFTTLGPLVHGQSVSEVGATAATLEALIDPQGQGTSYRFQYVTEAQFEQSGYAGAEQIPAGVAGIGSGNADVAVSQRPQNLAPATGYHFRVVAQNISGSVEGPDQAFATYEIPIVGLPDGRAYEQATPLNKNGTDPTGDINEVQAASGPNAGITFFSQAGLPGAEGAQDFSLYLASRDSNGAGWSTQGLYPRAEVGLGVGKVLGWSEDLSVALVTRSEPSDGVPAGLWVRDSSDGALEKIVDDVGAPNIGGITSGGARIVFETSNPLLPQAAPTRPNVYAWDRASDQLTVGGVLNSGAAPSEGAFVGPYDWFYAFLPGSGTPATGGARLFYYTQVEHAVSVEGDRLFFTAAGERGRAGQLYTRENLFAAQSALDSSGACTETGKACTTRVSASQKSNGAGQAGADAAGPRPAAFMAATPDGEKVFFASPEKLTDDANTGPEPSAVPAIARAEIGGAGTDLDFLPAFASGVAVGGGFVYWANPKEEAIGRAKLNGSGGATELKTEFISGIVNPQGVAVDGAHVYWTNARAGKDAEGTIGRANLDGSGVEAAFITGASNPQGIAVNATHVYWANVGALAATRKIGRANLSGGEVNQALTANNTTPLNGKAVGVSLSASKIYWTRNATTVANANLDGTSTVNCITTASTPAGVAVNSSFLYWANSASNAIGRANLDCTGPNQTFVTGAAKPQGFALDAEHLYWSASQEPPANPGNDLYRYDAESGELVDVAPDSTSANGAAVRGVLGISEDGGSVYYAANGVPDGAIANSPNPNGEAATPGNCTPLQSASGTFAFSGTCNLYLWRDDGTPDGATTFVARLSVAGNNEQSDAANWQPTSFVKVIEREKAARVSASGDTVLFRSQRQLTPYDNHGTVELYRYDVGEGLNCVSCNPTGAAPLGPPNLQRIRSPARLPNLAALTTRNLSLDGNRVFFETPDPLTAGDTNGAEGCPPIGGIANTEALRCQDVYEWEAPGTGSCTDDSQNGGCLYLLSNGTGSEPSFFADASPSGGDAYFFTRDQLVLQDKDALVDVYDARVGGGIAAQNREPQPTCQSVQACRSGEESSSAASGTPGSASFAGPGNAASRPRCGKGRHRVKGRCVGKRKKRAHKRHHRRDRQRANANRGVGR